MAIVTLDTTTAKLQVLLAGAVSATECPLTAAVIDERKDAIGGRADRGVPRNYASITTGGTAVDLVPVAPSNVRRSVVGFSCFNADSAEVDVTVRLYVDSSTTRIIHRSKLQTLETLRYDEDRGFYAVDVNSNQKSNASSTSGATSEATSKADSASTRASTADSKALSVSTLTSTADSKGVSAASVGSVADSKALSVSTLTSTADSKGVSAGTRASTVLSTVDSEEASSATRFSIVESTANSG